MKISPSNFVQMTMLSALLFSLTAFAVEGNDDFSRAFGAFKKAADFDVPSTPKADDVLDKAFGPVPEILGRPSAIAIDEITPEKSIAAVKALSSTQNATDEFEFRFESAGRMVSLVLWAGGGTRQLNALFKNLMTEMYSDKDAKNFKLVLTSSPFPSMLGQRIDFNREIREQKIAEAERSLKSRYFLTAMPKDELDKVVAEASKSVEPRWGVQVTISAGMFATFKNVDEFAGQLALALARLNPGVYGIKADPAFLRNQKNLKLIDDAVNSGDEETQAEIQQKRDEIDAELSAMERLLKAKLNPWAISEYEERVVSWLSDEYIKSAKYGLGRSLIDIDNANLVDWSRPVRFQIQDSYMKHLQSSSRGSHMRLEWTPFAMSLKLLRLRMAAYTKPFFTSGYQQLGTVALTGGATVSYFFFPEIAHWALAALHLTSEQSMQETIRNSWSFSETFKSLKDFGANLTDFGYLGEKISSGGKTILDHFDRFYGYYLGGLGVGVSLWVSRFVAREFAGFQNFLVSMKKSFITHQKVRARTDAPKDRPQIFEPRSMENVSAGPYVIMDSPDRNSEDKPEEVVEVVAGSTTKRVDWGERIGRKFAEILQALPTAHIALGKKGLSTYESATHMYEITREATGKKARIFAREAKNISVAAAQGTKAFAIRKKEQSIRLGRATITGSIAAGIAVGHAAVELKNGAVRVGGRAKIFVKRKGSETWEVASELTSRAAEASMSKMRDVIDATPGAAKTSSEFAIRYGSIGIRKTFSGMHWLFIKAPGASLAQAHETVLSIGNRIGDRLEESRQARLRYQLKVQEDLRFLQNGVERRNTFLSSQSLSLEEIQQVIEEFSTLFLQQNLRSDLSSEFWGIKDKDRMNRKSIEDYLFPVVRKWLDQEKLTPASEANFTSLFYIMTLVYNHVDQSFRSSEAFLKLSASIYERVKVRNLPGVNAMLESAANSKELSFLHTMVTRGIVKDAKATADGSSLVRASVQAAHEIQSSVVKMVMSGNEAPVFAFLSSPDVTLEQYTAFLTSIYRSYQKRAIFKIREIRRINAALETLTPLQRAKIYFFNERLNKTSNSNKIEMVSAVFVPSTDQVLVPASAQLVEQWIQQVNSIGELKALVEAITKQNNIWANDFQFDLQKAIERNVQLIKTSQDLEILFNTDFFWSEARARTQSSPLEAPLQLLLEKNRKEYANNPALKYDPIEAERMHSKVKARLEELGLFPNDFEGRLKIFKLFTQRGVSTVSDDLLGSLLKLGNTEQIYSLEDYATRQGRVFDQNLKDQFSIRQVERLEAYQKLIRGKIVNAYERMQALREIVRLAQELMTDMGLNYSDFLERLSIQISSTYDEAEFLNDAKGERIAQQVKMANSEEKGKNDNRMKVLTAILPEIKKWKPANQFDFLLYLRGSIAATPFIESQFPTFGPERVRKMFQSLPLESAMVITNIYLRETLLARKSVTEGYGRKLIDHLVKSGTDSTAQEYASLLLEGLLVGIEQAGNKRFQTHVLSALVAMKAGENRSVGETMKLILEQFPGVGPKIGQFLVGTGLLPEEINRVLIGTQDNTLPPSRFEIYSDIAMIAGTEVARGARVLQTLGAGSIKYTVKAVDPALNFELAIQIFRGDVQNSADFQIAILNGMIRHLIKRDGKKWAFLQVIVDGAMSAVQREKEFSKEAEKTAQAGRLYSAFNDSDFTVAVPEQDLLNDRLLKARFAKGGNFLKMVEDKIIDKEDTRKIGLKLLEMEAKILYGDSKGDIFYDTDRHAGNYLIHVEMRNGKKHYTISPIDFGQLTSIRVDQRDRVAKLFALAGAMGTFGANESFAQNVAETIGLDRSLVGKLKKVLVEFFPVAGQKNRLMVTHYFSLISAINETLYGQPASKFSAETKTGKLDMVYTDFVRAIIQLNQYEKELEGRGIEIPKNALTPRKILESRAKDHFADLAKDYKLSMKQKLLIEAKNAELWFGAVRRGQKFERMNIRPSREQLENMQMLGGVSRTEQKPVNSASSVQARRANSWTKVNTCQAIFQ